MKKALLLTSSFLLVNIVVASTESDFIQAHVVAFHELDEVVRDFEDKLSAAEHKDTALKYIDRYSLAIEKVLPVYHGFKKSKNELISEVSTDISTILTDIMRNNYELLGRLVWADLSQLELQAECRELISRNQRIAAYLMDVSIGVCMATVKNRPKDARETEQFSKLTEVERNGIVQLLMDKYGAGMGNWAKEESGTPFEYSCVAIYEFLGMSWNYEKE